MRNGRGSQATSNGFAYFFKDLKSSEKTIVYSGSCCLFVATYGCESAREFYHPIHVWLGQGARSELSVQQVKAIHCGDAGKMSDLMTTGTDPDVGMSAPTSM